MDRNIEKACEICYKKMRSDVMKRHMEKHNILEKTEVKQSSKCSINVEEVEKILLYWQEEFERKLELGTIINNYMNKNELARAALSTDELEALGIYETYVNKTKSRGNIMERMAKGFKKIFGWKMWQTSYMGYWWKRGMKENHTFKKIFVRSMDVQKFVQ